MMLMIMVDHLGYGRYRATGHSLEAYGDLQEIVSMLLQVRDREIKFRTDCGGIQEQYLKQAEKSL